VEWGGERAPVVLVTVAWFPLLAGRGRRYYERMTVSQLLKRVKALPTKQRDRLVREILALETRSHANRPGRRAARVTWPDVEARAKQIVGDRVLPNLVLLERGEETH
jgi:hypothetical protein